MPPEQASPSKSVPVIGGPEDHSNGPKSSSPTRPPSNAVLVVGGTEDHSDGSKSSSPTRPPSNAVLVVGGTEDHSDGSKSSSPTRPSSNAVLVVGGPEDHSNGPKSSSPTRPQSDAVLVVGGPEDLRSSSPPRPQSKAVLVIGGTEDHSDGSKSSSPTRPPSNAVLVVGGGIAGIETALNLAGYGAHVFLVDDTPSIGGLMARLDKTFPTNDCSICIQAPMMYEVGKAPNITLLTNTEVRRVEGQAPQFKVRLVQKPRFVDETKCKGCGKCTEACPVTVADELDSRIGGKRKLISIPFPQAVPNTYVVDGSCRFGKMRSQGACIGGCIVDCSQCRECQIAKCVVACRKEGADAVLLWQKERLIDIDVRSIVVATGVESYVPPVGLYGYGVYPNVLTNYQFERLMNAGGPTVGNIARPSDGGHPHRIAWIQCVGREASAPVKYCSKVCCMIATKQAIIAKEHDPSVEAIVLYNNLKSYGKGFYAFYRRATEHGVKYLKGKPADVFEDPDTKTLRIVFEDLDKGRTEELEVDILVLSTGLVPGTRTAKLAKALKLPLDEFGFIKERDPLCSPLETSVKGIYVCGGAGGPIDISESVSQAAAVSLKAVSGGS